MSLGELLCAVLILTLVSGGMASAVSLGVRQYQQSMRTSEAKVLCSTLETVLRNELAYTTQIKLDGGNVKQFRSQNFAIKKNLSTLTTDAENSGDYGHIILANCDDPSEYMEILGKGAYTNGLLAKVDKDPSTDKEIFTYNKSNHCFMVQISVGCNGQTYATRRFQVINANYKKLEQSMS